MSYKKAKDVLPEKLLKTIQQYVEGEYVYIPKIEQTKKNGEITLQQNRCYITGI